MKPIVFGRKKGPSLETGAEVALSLQQELVDAIRGAFEVAVEVAVREVTELLGQATEDICEDMRLEHEALKQKLRRAEAALERALMEGGRSGSPPASKQLPTTSSQAHRPFHLKNTAHKVGSVHLCTEGIGNIPAGHSRVDQLPPSPKDSHVCSNDEQRSDHDVKAQHVIDAASRPEKEYDDGCASDDGMNTFYSSIMSKVNAM